MPKNSLFTIGHSNRAAGQFLTLLEAHRIGEVVDIRTIPRSRHNPQFNQAKIRKFLENHGIHYRHLKELGGLRHAKKDSVNLGWENASFQGFADYMQTGGFADGLKKLKKIARRRKTVIMCAEAVPWQCHRSLIADALEKQGWQVFHIQSQKTAKLHKLTPFLRIKGGRITYPAPR